VSTVYLAPDREPVFSQKPVATNHQGFIDWPEQARATRTLEREQHVMQLLEQPHQTVEGLAEAFLRPELFTRAYDRGFGTLYTAVYRTIEGRAEFRWPGFTWPQSFGAFEEGLHQETLVDGVVA
jgi:predicted choloylglycine hydrolase